MQKLEYPHLFITGSPETQKYTSPISGRNNFNFPDRLSNRVNHANLVRQALDGAWKKSNETKEARKAVSLPTINGTYIEFESAPDFDLLTKSLEQRQAGIRLLNVCVKKNDAKQSKTYATVFIPDGKEAVLLKKINQYETEDTKKTGRPRNEPLISSIDNLREAVLESFWRDKLEFIPSSLDWCEVWLRYTETHEEVIDEFHSISQQLKIDVQEQYLIFPERIVLLAKLDANLINELLLSSNYICEFRKAKSTADFWMKQDNAHQAEWANSLAVRLIITSETNTQICILDTGVNNGHVLLNKIISDEDCHSINSDWGVTDNNGHGTLMCGVAAFGSQLDALLQSTHNIDIPYKLESVKLIPTSGDHHKKELYGFHTKQAISRAEIEKPNHNRAICLSITSDDSRDEGRPSSWSGSIDQICSGTEDGIQRLLVVAGGNIKDPNEWSRYPDSNITNAVHDPGQAWNAITVGAYTNKVEITDKDLAKIYSPLANEGQLSPFSTTSHIWDAKWPNKPDIVFEGGNAGIDGDDFATEIDDLSILSTHHQPNESQFSVMNATSAATAQASRMAGLLMSQYPSAWPETIRALMIHSAEWTSGLRNQFHLSKKTEKHNFSRLLRTCGYGVPNLRRAMESARNSLTLITEQEIQPFTKKASSSDYETKDMHLIELPWPVEALQTLPDDTNVTIEITLSYFVQPGPGEVGWRDKYRYRSHGLDFELKNPTEDREDFMMRLNKAARDEGSYESNGSSVSWAIGNHNRNRGSIHRDWWNTTAAEAAACNMIGIYPKSGWWKERAHLKMGESVTRYCLIVSLKTDATEIDIYTPIANVITTPIKIET